MDVLDISTSTAWGVLNTLISINCAVIAGRLFIRASRGQSKSGGRILYGAMFTAFSVFFAVMAVYQWFFSDGRPDAGLVGLALIWWTTTVAVLYLVVWKRHPGSGM